MEALYLAVHGGVVARGRHLRRDPGHIPRDACEAADRVRGVGDARVGIHRVDVNRIPAALDGGASRATVLVDVWANSFSLASL